MKANCQIQSAIVQCSRSLTMSRGNFYKLTATRSLLTAIMRTYEDLKSYTTDSKGCIIFFTFIFNTFIISRFWSFYSNYFLTFQICSCHLFLILLFLHFHFIFVFFFLFGVLVSSFPPFYFFIHIISLCFIFIIIFSCLFILALIC